MSYKEFERLTEIKLKWWQKIHINCKSIIRKLNPNSPVNKFKRFTKEERKD